MYKQNIKRRYRLIALILVLCSITAMLAFTACTKKDPVVTSIEITTKPTKLEYFEDETFSVEGGILTATYDNGDKETKKFTDEGVEVTPPSMTVLEPAESAKKNVAVRYAEQQANFDIKVSIRKFVVTFDVGYDNTKNTTAPIRAGKPVTRPTDPIRTDYIFDDWYSDEDCTMLYDFSEVITEDTTVYAKWLEDAKYHNFVFNYNHDNLKVPSVTQKVKDGEKATILSVDPIRTGYRFDGWWSDATGATQAYDFNTAVDGDTNIYAKWTKTASGKNTYVFEAEDTNLLGKNYPSWSGTVSNTGLIHTASNLEASNNRFVGYLYEMGCSIEFQITSDIAVSDATLIFRFSAEYDMEFDSSSFAVNVNQQAMTYSKISFTGINYVNDGSLNCPKFADYTIATNLTLKKGFNIITVVTQNEVEKTGTTYKACAPLVDCLKINTEAVLTWGDLQGLPKKNY